MNCRVEVSCDSLDGGAWGLAFDNLDRAWQHFSEARTGLGVVRVELRCLSGAGLIKYWTPSTGVVCAT